MQTTQRITSLSVLSAVALMALTACGGSSDHSSGSSSASASSSASQASTAGEASGSGLKITGAWAKAAGSGMTAVFGTIENTSDHEITVSSASSKAASTVQLHETVMDQSSGSSRMQQKKGGFRIKAGEKKQLAPGGDHIMFMDLKCSLLGGDTIAVTVKTEDGKSLSVDAPIRDYQAAQENYGPSSGASASPSATSSSVPAPDHGNGNQSMRGMDSSSGSMDGMEGMGSSSALPSCSE